MKEDKNQLSKLYSINGHPIHIEFSEIQKFYSFDEKTKSSKVMNHLLYLNSNIHLILVDTSNTASMTSGFGNPHSAKK